MLFEDILITILKAVDGERTISSPYHLIKGKKSGQTIQDIGYYKLHPYFGVMPKLEKKVYDKAVRKLFEQGFIITDGQVVRMTEASMALQTPVPLLNGWKYRGKEQLFMARLSLIVQSLSQIHQNQRAFDPVVIAEDIQQWVKKYLHRINYRDAESCRNFKTELAVSLSKVDVDAAGKRIVVQRLSGFKIGGLTWEQIAAAERLEVIDVQLQAIETLHAWMDVLETRQFPMMSELLDGVIQQSSLTETARRTEYYFRNGRSLEEIASLRGLKTSTIEDHFVELAINDPGFDILAFMDGSLYSKIIAVSHSRNTKRLRDIKEAIPEAGYFKIRLALATKGETL